MWSKCTKTSINKGCLFRFLFIYKKKGHLSNLKEPSISCNLLQQQKSKYFQDSRWCYTSWSKATDELTQRSSPLRRCNKGDRCRVLSPIYLFRQDHLVHQHETSKQRWCENHVLYFLSIHHEEIDRARCYTYVGEIRSRYMSLFLSNISLS
jgi:hypothetical protein